MNEYSNEKTIPLVSIIIPVYNTASWLRECLDSVINQTLRNIEIICINDGSVDDSVNILRKYAERDSRIHIIEQENKGLSESRNAGVRMAAGKYLSFVDSDDVLELTALELCSGCMEAQKLDYLCFNASAFGEDAEFAKLAEIKNRAYFRRALNEDRIYEGKTLFSELKEEGRYTAPVWSCMISRALFVDCGCWFHPEILHEDEPWTFKVLMNAARCGCLNSCLYHYRIRSGSITQQDESFSRVYGLFIGALDIQEILLNRPDLMQERKMRSLILDHADKLIKKASQNYSLCSASEQQKRESLNAEERILFEQAVVYPASLLHIIEQKTAGNDRMQNSIDKLSERIDSLEAEGEKNKLEIRDLSSQNTSLKQQNKELYIKYKRLCSKLAKIEKSKSYRISQKISRTCRKLKLY